MPKQCEIVAVVKDRKRASQEAMTAAYKKAQNEALWTGQVRSYAPSVEGEPEQPAQRDQVKYSFRQMLEEVRGPIVATLDTVLTQDMGNLLAKADVQFGGTTLQGIPATHLLVLEKFLEDLSTLVKAVPTLSPEYRWSLDESSGEYRSEPTQQARTKKVKTPIVLYDATEKHPAQTQLIDEDVTVGYYSTTKVSGAMGVAEKRKVMGRITELMDVVRRAREVANATAVTPMKEGDAILDYIFGG